METEQTNPKGKRVIEVMCDYCADGLWLDGKSIDLDYMKSLINMTDDTFTELSIAIPKWQAMYETFDFYSRRVKAEDIFESNDYDMFNRLGRYIFQVVHEIEQDDYTIIFYDEKENIRYTIKDNEWVVYG